MKVFSIRHTVFIVFIFFPFYFYQKQLLNNVVYLFFLGKIMSITLSLNLQTKNKRRIYYKTVRFEHYFSLK